jgi:ATPase MipZ
MDVGQRVATIDLDSRQKRFTRYVELRRDWAKRTRRGLKIPTHACMARAAPPGLDDNNAIAAAPFAQARVRREVLQLLEGLKLPLNADGRWRAAARQEWFAAQGRSPDMHDFIGA